MTLNILEIEKKVGNVDAVNLIGTDGFDSTEKRVNLLQELQATLKNNGGKLNWEDPIIFVDILSSSFSDTSPSTRILSMDILSDAIPMYGYDLDNHMGLLFPQLLQNLLHRNAPVKKAALQTLHTYFKHSSNKSMVINYLIKHGINNSQRLVRNEVLLAIPALIRSGFTDVLLEPIFTSVLKTVSKIENGDSTLPVVLCLEHIKGVMDHDHFEDFVMSLDDDLNTKYRKTLENSSFVRTSSNSGVTPRLDESEKLIMQSDIKNKNGDIIYGFVPARIINRLTSKNTWQERSEAINDLMEVVSLNADDDLLKENYHKIFEHLVDLVDDTNLNVSLTALNIVHNIILKINVHVQTHLPIVIKTLFKKLNDPKLVVRKINLRISLSLMHCLSPMKFIQSVIPYLKHKNTRTREEVVNMVTAALLSFPSCEFDLPALAGQLAFTLLDPKRRVRHASLECFTILAQHLGSGQLSPLVSAVNALESVDGGDGVLVAVQARIQRRKLPCINQDGLVEYALNVPANSSRGAHMEPDVAWVKAGSSAGGGNTSRHSHDDGIQRRRFSAGKKKLPWQNDDEFNVEVKPRKTVGSAPVRLYGHNNLVNKNNDVMRSSSNSNKITSHSNAASHHDPYIYPRPESPGVTFEMHKQRMKIFKAAGLQADSAMINPNMAFLNMLPPNVRDGRQFNMTYNKLGSNSNAKDDTLILEDACTSPLFSPTNGTSTPTRMLSPNEKVSPVPVKPALARSASKKKQKMRMESRKQWDMDKEYNNESILAHTLPKTNKDPLARRRISLDSSSPFPSRPTIHRTPSGRLTNRTNPHTQQGTAEVSNLNRMKKLSNSTPAIPTNLITANVTPEILSPVSPVGRHGNHSPCIRIPHAKVLSPVSTGNSPRHKSFNEYPMQGKGESSMSSPDSLDENELPGAPKLARSAQEKLRKLKEDRLRQSTDTALVVQRKKENRMSRSLDTVDGLKRRTSYTEQDYDWHSLDDKQKQDSEGKGSREEQVLKEKQLRLTNEKQKILAEDIHQNNENNQSILNHDDIPVGNFKKNRRHPKPVAVNKSIEVPLNRRPQKIIDSFTEFEIETTTENVVSEWLPGHEQNDINRNSHDLQINGAAMFQNHVSLDDNKINKENKKARKGREKNKNTDFNNNSSDNEDLMIQGKKQQKATRSIPLKASSSPQVQRKNVTSSSPRMMEEETPPPRSSSYSEDLEQHLSNPQQAVAHGLKLLASGPEDWECKCEGLVTFRRLAKFHPEYLSDDFHMIVEAVLGQVKNLRSQVTRLALSSISDLFLHVPRLVEPELEVILKTILLKAGDTNQFIRADVEHAMNNLVDHVHPVKAISAIIVSGSKHINAHVRKTCAKSLADIAENIGSARLLSSHKDIVPIASKLAVDAQPDARYHARRILLLLVHHPELDSILQKRLASVNLRPVRDIVENLKNKGLGEPPTGSASLRKSMRNSTMPSPATSRRSRNITPTRSVLKDAENMDGIEAEAESRSSGRRKKRVPGGDKMAVAQLDYSKLDQLEASSWSERYEALDDFYDLVSMNPAGVAAHAIKVFDKFCPRLSDSNRKVNLYALQTLNRCIPILRNGISSAMTVIINNLKVPLSSKNEAIFQAAKECLVTLTKYVENSCLVQPLVTCVQYGNTRNKPELTERLADIIEPVFSRKPGLITRIVLPLLWNILSASPSGASTPGRANLQHSINRLCNILYSCLGEKLIEEAELKGARASQRLEAFLEK